MNTWLSRIRLTYRPLLIVGALLLPLAGLFYFMLAGYSQRIEFVRMELRGLVYLRPLDQLLELLPEHATTSSPTGAGDLNARIDQIFESVAQADREVGAQLDFTADGLRRRQREAVLLTAFRSAWADLKAFAGTNQAGHDAMIATTRMAITHAGDTSGLILDPVLDTYYLVDALLGALPATQERAFRITEFASRPCTNLVTWRAQAAVFASQVQDNDLDRVVSSLQTSLNERANLSPGDQELKTALKAPIEQYQAMVQNLRGLLRDISSGIKTLATSSTQLSTISKQFSAGSKSTADRANSVSVAAEEMSASATSVASGMELATTRLNSVATATEEMNSTIGEIASSAEKARSVTSHADEEARHVTSRIEELTKAAQAIGQVTQTITRISDQTRLLALNATIEAARAGASGKGFAVVANEIKELARQTANATEDIKTRISGIQSSTTETLDDLGRISVVISQVNEGVNSIASAIEEQSVAAKDIARNVGEAASEVTQASHQVSRISEVSRSLSEDFTSVNTSAREMTAGSEQILTSAGELSGLASRLQMEVSRFRLEAVDSVMQSPSRHSLVPSTRTGRSSRTGVGAVQQLDA